MKKNKNALSIIEAIVVLLILSTSLVAIYSLFIKSVRTTDNLEHKIQAIQIAREGIEAMQNIRDTNWLLFPLDKKNCFNTLDYNPSCLNNPSLDGKIGNSTSYIIYRDADGRWRLRAYVGDSNNMTPANYRDFFKVSLDEKGLYTQGGSEPIIMNNYTREIVTNYTSVIASDINSGLNVKSIVKWYDSQDNTMELELTLANFER